ncbi:hypothetical protein FB45DRAFT_340640 [Roridomyces roridus]|uniref:Uncharacterized protein n=1 Tax=Roridomyces roridus TaxID=1738132 RepID=A0AAD7B534_9AGAR|nr:hypothetical protein FB45DRAFT_340640 [Roridomyces roridus]
MRLTTTFAVLAAVLTGSLAQQTIVSPTAGQTISINKAFNLTYVTQRSGGFEENSIKIDVVISNKDATFPFPGGLPFSDLTPTGTAADGSSIYSAFANPIVLDGDAVGDRLVAVVEYFNGAGGEPGLDVVFVPVTFVDSPP